MGIGPTATILQQIFEGDPLACPTCHGAMRLVTVITQTSVIDQILTHRRTRTAREAHAAPDWPPPAALPHGVRRSHGPQSAAGDCVVYSTDSRPAPIEIPIPS